MYIYDRVLHSRETIVIVEQEIGSSRWKHELETVTRAEGATLLAREFEFPAQRRTHLRNKLNLFLVLKVLLN